MAKKVVGRNEEQYFILLCRINSSLSWSRSYKTFFLRQQRISLFFAAKLGHFIIYEFSLNVTKMPA